MAIIIPMLVLFFTFHTFSFLKGIFYSFTDWKGYGTWDFVGIANYLKLWGDEAIGDAYKFTFKYTGQCDKPSAGPGAQCKDQM